MIEKINPVDVVNADFGKIHGHTKIILTSVKDGSQKVIEHDNTFQSSVIAKYLRSLGTFDNSPWANTSWGGMQMFNMLCGGILLFEDAIDNTQNDVEYMPAGNKMIANGAYNVSNASTPVELGTYNTVESSTSGNSSLTFVYDWGTSQGNGTISCVCLTSEIGGYIGYGNPSGVQASTTKAMKQNQVTRFMLGSKAVVYKNTKYTFSVNSSNQKVTVTKSRFAVDQASIFQGKQISVTDLTYTQNLTSATNYFCKYIGGGKVAIMPGTTNITNGSTLYFLILDLETNMFAQGTIVNNTGNILETAFGTDTCFFGMVGNYVALSTRSTSTSSVKLPIYVFDATDGSLVTTISGTADLGATQPAAAPLTDELILLANGGVFDPVNETAYPCNGYMSDTAGSGGFYQYNDNVDALVGGCASGTTGAYKNPLFLATINNLEAPITKDSTQTMKVIYTLTEA